MMFSATFAPNAFASEPFIPSAAECTISVTPSDLNENDMPGLHRM